VPNTIQKLPNEQIVVDTMSPDYHLSVELPQGISKLFEVADGLAEPVFWIVDASVVKEVTIEDLLTGTELLIRGKNPLYRHRNMREVLYVSTSPMVRLAAAGLANELFGNLKIRVFDNIESALQYARKQL
jgi:hypothetical protein